MKNRRLLRIVLSFLFAGMFFSGLAVPPFVCAPSSYADQLISEVESVTLPQPDFSALFSSHDPQEVVAVVNGHDVTWENYFYFYYSTASALSDMMQYYANFGTQMSWNDVYDSSAGITYAQLPVINAGQDIMRFSSIADFMSDSEITLNETSNAVLAEMLRTDIDSFSSEADPEAAFTTYLASKWLPEDLYHFLSQTSVLYQQAFSDLYGKDGSSVPDDVVISYLAANGYVTGMHMFLAFMDAYTGEIVSEDEIRAKRELSATLVTELNSVADVKERKKAFDAYRADLDEDAASFYFPDGYTISGGYIPDKLFSALKIAKDNEVLAVETSSGVYIAMKLPPDPDGLTGYSEQGTPLTARSLYANEDYALRLEKEFAETDFQYAEDFKVPNVNDYLR